MTLAKEAFQAIADAGAPFASRGDKSGTHSKELAIWASIPFTPTAEMGWYNALGQGMGDTLIFANERRPIPWPTEGPIWPIRIRRAQ